MQEYLDIAVRDHERSLIVFSSGYQVRQFLKLAEAIDGAKVSRATWQIELPQDPAIPGDRTIRLAVVNQDGGEEKLVGYFVDLLVLANLEVLDAEQIRDLQDLARPIGVLCGRTIFSSETPGLSRMELAAHRERALAK